MNYFYKWLSVLSILCMALGVYAQERLSIRGTVHNSSGEALVGATISVKSTDEAVSTDADGRYTITAKPSDVLVFSSMGYTTTEESIGNRSVIDVELLEGSSALDEVVVIGYGTQKKVNLTGAVSSIDFTDVAETRPITSLSAGLAGLSSGIQVRQATGQPGVDGATLRIRGQGTLNNSDPLVLVDGVPSNMNDVNPQDVANISILKDAASAAIYGSRAANGVILVTTKKGISGQSSLSYNVRLSQQRPSNLIELVTDYPTHMELINEGFNNQTPDSGPFTQAIIDEWRAKSSTDPLLYPNTNWFDWILRDEWAQEHNLSASGGNDKTTYLLSGNYLNSPGLVENAGFEKYGIRVNLESNVKPWLTVGTTSFGLWSNRGLANIQDLFAYTAASVPGILPRHPDGRYGSAMAVGENLQANNYLHNINSTVGGLERQKVFSRVYGKVDFTPDLRLESGFSIDFSHESQRSHNVYIPRWNFQLDQITNPNPSRTSVYNTHQRDFQYVMNHVLTYNKDFNDHHLDVMGGYQEEYYRRNNFNARQYDMIDESTPVLDATSTDPVVGGNATDWALRSFFGRINYNFKERYLFEANLRDDGSSRFAEERRWGLFPSFSAGWRLSEEDFMKEVNFIDNLKLRASWGSLGNNSIGNYDYQSVYGNSNYSLGGTIVQGTAPSAISNPFLTWEKTNITNVGIDVMLVDNRLSLEMDWFNKLTKDILIELPIPLVNGNLSAPKQNAAEVLNRGIEVNLGWQDHLGEFQYGLNANVTYVKNEVLKFKGEEFSLGNQNILLEGHPIWSFYLRDVDRIVTEEDMPMINQLVTDGYTFQPGIPKPGDLLYVDSNGDKKFNDDDRTIIDASNNPEYLFGLNLSASYKGFHLDALLQGQAGNKAYWRDGYMTTGVRNGYHINKDVAENHWTPENQSAKYPRLVNYTYNQNTGPASTFWLQDASYLRLKNIQLGYSIPTAWAKKIKTQRFYVYVNAENLITFTGYEGIDPEITRLGSTQTLYPTMKQISFGVNVTF